MSQYFHWISSHSSLIAMLEDLLTGYRVTGLLSNIRKCSNILPSGTFSKGIRTNLRSPNGWWHGRCTLCTDLTRPFFRSSRAILHTPRKVSKGGCWEQEHLFLPTSAVCVCWRPIHCMGSGHSCDFGHLTTSKIKGRANKHVGYKKLFRYLGCLLLKSITTNSWFRQQLKGLLKICMLQSSTNRSSYAKLRYLHPSAHKTERLAWGPWM